MQRGPEAFEHRLPVHALQQIARPHPVMQAGNATDFLRRDAADDVFLAKFAGVRETGASPQPAQRFRIVLVQVEYTLGLFGYRQSK